MNGQVPLLSSSQIRNDKKSWLPLMYDFQANPHSKRENAPPGSHLNNLLSNLFILQKEGSRLSQENLRADVSLLESPFNPETSGRKPSSHLKAK